MNEKNLCPGSIQLPKGGKESRVSVKIYDGVLYNKSQYVVEITRITGENPVYYKYADLMNVEGTKKMQIKDALMNQFGLERSGLRKIQNEVENLLKQNQYELIDECKTRLFLGVDDNELEQEETLSRAVIEQHYNDVINFISNNIEFFPVRNLNKGINPDEGYIKQESLGVYIADEQGLKEYGEEVVAISRQCVQDLISKNTTQFRNIVKRLMMDGYFVDSTTHSGDLKQIKLRYGVLAKRMYLVRISGDVKTGWES